VDVPCPVCGCVEIGPTRQGFTDPVNQTTYRLHRCRRCDVEFWEPLTMPPPSYYETAVGSYRTYHAGTARDLSPWHRTFLDRLCRASPGRVLDIGCADGRFLEELQRRGWEVCGLDFDRRSVEAARRRCGTAAIHACSLEDASTVFSPASFDLVTFFEVLEHQVAPVTFLEHVRRMVARGGTIGGSVPNRGRYIVPTRMSPDLPPHHFTLWDSDVIVRFLEAQGFADARTLTARYEPFLLEQVMHHFLRRQVQALKTNTGVRSFQSAEYGGSSNRKGRALTALRRYAWNPVMTVLELPEYPLLKLTKRGINLCFSARLADPLQPLRRTCQPPATMRARAGRSASGRR
jgi:2-polyprenyl-3-methyl-5-hydroxy-6-metoxy-1,4-benzoquinol methylase